MDTQNAETAYAVPNLGLYSKCTKFSLSMKIIIIILFMYEGCT